MKTLDEIKRRIKIEYVLGIQRSITELIKDRRGDHENCVYFTMKKNDNEINKAISQEVLDEVANAGYKVEIDDENEIFTRYKIIIDL